jgi:hypothetical protein
MKRTIDKMIIITILMSILTFFYVIQLVLVIFTLINPFDDKDCKFKNKKEFLKNLIPFYFVYKKYKELEE